MNTERHDRRCPVCGHGFVLMSSECPVCNEVKPGAPRVTAQRVSAAPSLSPIAALHALSGRIVMIAVAALSLMFVAMQ